VANTILEAIGNYLVAQGQGTLGTNLFLSRMPETPDACVCIYEGEGGLPEFTMGNTILDNPAIQIIVRGTREDYVTARDKAQTIRLLLAQLADQTLSGVTVLRVAPIGSVLPMGLDKNDRPMVSTNYRAIVSS
jgi:hypothetical protein